MAESNQSALVPPVLYFPPQKVRGNNDNGGDKKEYRISNILLTEPLWLTAPWGPIVFAHRSHRKLIKMTKIKEKGVSSQLREMRG